MKRHSTSYSAIRKANKTTIEIFTTHPLGNTSNVKTIWQDMEPPGTKTAGGDAKNVKPFEN